MGLFRTVLPIAALAGGTWLGLGKPDLDTLRAKGMAIVRIVAGNPSSVFPDRPPPPLEPAAPPIRESPAREVVPSAGLAPKYNVDASVSRAWLLAEGPYLTAKDPHRYITLTFDDGPFPETTPKVLDLLQRVNARATFFLISRYLEGTDKRAVDSREAALQLVSAGHLVGNHTEDHLKLTPGVPLARAIQQIDEAQATLQSVTGKRPEFFRPPFGELDPRMESAVRERGLDLVLWSVSADDMNRSDSDGIFEDLRTRIEFAGGGVVLLHDMRWPSVHALERLVNWLRRHAYDPKKPDVRGYEVVDLPEYMRLTALRPQPFQTRQALDEWRRAAWGRKSSKGKTQPPMTSQSFPASPDR